MRSPWLALVLLALVLAACGGEEPGTTPDTGGEKAIGPLMKASLKGPGGMSCATCHTLEGEFDAPAIAGPLVGHRTGYWGEVLTGDGDTLEAAIAYCLQRFVLGQKPTGGDADHPGPGDFASPTPSQTEWIVGLADEIRVGIAPANPLSSRTMVFATADDLAAIAALEAEASRGATVYRASCAVCHGAAGEGGIGHELRGLQAPTSLTIEYVRLGHEDMPPFSTQALTDEHVADVARFVLELK